jgi:hypothetical protein
MSIYDLERIQQSCAWIDRIAPLPVEAIAEELVGRAHDVLAAQPEGPSKQWVKYHMGLVFDPAALAEDRRERSEALFVSKLERWLGDVTTDADNGAPISDPVLAEAWEECRNDIQAAESQAKLAEIDKTITAAEIGVNFGEDPDGDTWYEADTICAVEKVIKLQDELGVSIVTDKIRDLTIRGITHPFNGQAARLLIRLATTHDDYESFLAAGAKHKAATDQRRSTDGCEQTIVETATKYIESGKLPMVDRRVLDIGLHALAYYDPIITFYPLHCARLGFVLRGL